MSFNKEIKKVISLLEQFKSIAFELELELDEIADINSSIKFLKGAID